MSSQPTPISIQDTLRQILLRLKSIHAHHLSPLNITPQQARLVRFVGERAKRGWPTCQKDIEVAMDLTGPSVTSLVQGLERRGFVTRHGKRTDGRRKEVAVTPTGQTRIDSFRTIFEMTEKKLTEGFDAQERACLVALLGKVLANIE